MNAARRPDSMHPDAEEALLQIGQLNEELAQMQRALVIKNAELENALEELRSSSLHVRKLEGILPICAECKSVRDDTDTWMDLDAYLTQKKMVSLSHGFCPSCEGRWLEGLDQR